MFSRDNFQKICNDYELGEFQSETVVEGGRIHKTYKITTLKDNREHYFALKVLNPITIKTEFEKNRFIITDKITREFSDAGINSVPSITGTIGSLIQDHNEFNYMVFPWIDGKTLNFDDIEDQHCLEVGKQLATMHHYFKNREEKPYQNDMQGSYQFNFQEYLKSPILSDHIKNILTQHINRITEILICYNQASIDLGNEIPVKAHGDMDSSNTVWQGDKPFFIDWEKATGAISPSKDYMITAVYWSRTSSGKFSDSHFASFHKGYQQFFQDLNLPSPAIDQKAGTLALLAHWLIWVDFNFQRASNHSVSIEQISIAEQQIEKTLLSISKAYEQYYIANSPQGSDNKVYLDNLSFFNQQNNRNTSEPPDGDILSTDSTLTSV